MYLLSKLINLAMLKILINITIIFFLYFIEKLFGGHGIELVGYMDLRCHYALLYLDMNC